VTYPLHPDSNVAIAYDGASDGPNALGRIARVSDRAGTTEFAYDSLGRATRETRAVGRWNGEDHMTRYVTESAYDTWGRVQQMVYPDGEVLTYAYDSGGQVRSAEGMRFGTKTASARWSTRSPATARSRTAATTRDAARRDARGRRLPEREP